MESHEQTEHRFMKLTATFFSHFGAISYKNLCEAHGITAAIGPVPRSLSSSCGSCVIYEAEILCPVQPVPEEVEQIAVKEEKGYRIVYSCDNME